jgi:hypothetical protein
MKTFVLSLCVFGTLLLTILFNCLFVDRTMDTLELTLETLPACEEATESVEALTHYWERCHNELSFSISHSEIREMDNCILQMRIAAQSNSSYEYELARALGLEAIHQMRRLERFSWDGIL